MGHREPSPAPRSLPGDPHPRPGVLLRAAGPSHALGLPTQGRAVQTLELWGFAPEC